MESCSSEFEMSVWEVDGLTEFYPGRVPSWLRQMFSECSSVPTPAGLSDEEFVRTELHSYRVARGPWLYGWGEAVINGQHVFLFETDYLSDPVCIAADWRIGITFLEPSEQFFNEYFLAYLFERGRRPVSDDATEAGLILSLATASAE
jgi:hypothetical protein